MEYVNTKLIEFNKYLENRKVAILGLGVSNLPLIDYLHDNKAQVTVFDEKEIDAIPKDIMDKITKYAMEFSLGKNALSKLVGFDLIFRSPSILPTHPMLEAESDRGAIVTTEIEMLIEMCPSKVIGITGSDGKTTTTSLINHILEKAGYKTFLGGNIGTPLFTKLPEITPEDMVVLELSSFQLMGMEISPQIAVMTNITPNHLNIHKDYQEYIDAKKNIFKYQDENGILVLNYDNEITRECAKKANGKVIFFSSKTKLDNGYIVDEDVIKECDDKVRKHNDFCNTSCPHRTKEHWNEFVNAINSKLGNNNNYNVPNNNNTKYKVGENVTINGVYTSSTSTQKLNPARKTGTITKIIPGVNNPYLLDNGNLGWVNDNCIVGMESSASSTSINFSKGQSVLLKASATKYCTGETIPAWVKNKKYTIMQVGTGNTHPDGVLLEEIMSWVYKKDVQ